MTDLVPWLFSVPGHSVARLFDADERLAVRTRTAGPEGRRLLCRAPEMEAAVIDQVERGLEDPAWQGLLYVMGWTGEPGFRPLYVGKAERRGVKNELSANLACLRSNRHKFARWGDGVAYHIGDLSHALFGFRAYREPTPKYRRWAVALFDSFDPPRLRQPVALYLASWRDGQAGPSGLTGSLAAVEKEVIALASVHCGDCLLNLDGI